MGNCYKKKHEIIVEVNLNEISLQNQNLLENQRICYLEEFLQNTLCNMQNISIITQHSLKNFQEPKIQFKEKKSLSYKELLEDLAYTFQFQLVPACLNQKNLKKDQRSEIDTILQYFKFFLFILLKKKSHFHNMQAYFELLFALFKE